MAGRHFLGRIGILREAKPVQSFVLGDSICPESGGFFSSWLSKSVGEFHKFLVVLFDSQSGHATPSYCSSNSPNNNFVFCPSLVTYPLDSSESWKSSAASDLK